MNTSSGSLGPLVFVAVCVAVLTLVWIVSTKNRIVRLRNLVRESWSDVDVTLKRRHDLVPNLVATVKGYATHERETLELVVRAREDALAAIGELKSLGASEAKLESALHAVFMRAEAYPELKADQHFIELQAELSRTEDRIAAARRLYNANVRELNTAIETFPNSLIVGRVSPADYFELSSPGERAVPSV